MNAHNHTCALKPSSPWMKKSDQMYVPHILLNTNATHQKKLMYATLNPPSIKTYSLQSQSKDSNTKVLAEDSVVYQFANKPCFLPLLPVSSLLRALSL